MYVGEGDTEPPIYMEDNDYECLLGHWVDDGEWISPEHSDPVFPTFGDWFAALVDVVCGRRFDPEENDAPLEEMYAHPRRA